MEYLRRNLNVIQSTPETVLDVIDQADGLCVRTYTQVNEALLAKATRLKVVGRAGVALENIDVPACFARGVQVVHTPAANTLAVVDFVTGLLVQMNRRYWPIQGRPTPQEFHKIRKNMFGRFLSGLTLGIIGAGRIGSRVGRVANALGMKVLYNDIKPIELDYPATSVDKPTLYASSDIITIHTPLTNLTRYLIDAKALAQFKMGAQFINAARGQCVNYQDLAEAIRSGRVSAAAIDCHDPEPPPADYPLYGLENVILTAHVAARVPEAMENMSGVVYDIVGVLQGKEAQWPALEGAY